VVQVVAYVGWRLGGWPGSVIATVRFILPSALLMLGLAYGYAVVATPGAAAARRGVLAVGAFAIVALLPNASPRVVISAGLVGLVMFHDLR
jgi:chromate transport protein ChrA